jgi:hypothetical protein
MAIGPPPGCATLGDDAALILRGRARLAGRASAKADEAQAAPAFGAGQGRTAGSANGTNRIALSTDVL